MILYTLRQFTKKKGEKIMACIKNVTGDRLVPCGAPTAMYLGAPKGVRILNESHIASYQVSYGNATVTRAAGAPAAAEIETVNNSAVITVGTRGGETFVQSWDVTVECTFFRGFVSADTLGAADGAGMNSRVVIAVNHGNGNYRIYGLFVPLTLQSVEGASNGNGYIKSTFGVDEWQTGTTIFNITKAFYDSLATPIPSGGGDTEP